jgi:hypothetical protein
LGNIAIGTYVLLSAEENVVSGFVWEVVRGVSSGNVEEDDEEGLLIQYYA